MKPARKVLFIGRYFSSILIKWAVAVFVLILLIIGPVFLFSFLSK
tara:strand:- start:46 stop:180 length:135 start_codon:yes stop_codon:yes gene_type:complete